jgi:hypothetical protein
MDSGTILSLQTIGAIIAITCSSITFCIFIGFLFSFLGIGLYDVNPKVLNCSAPAPASPSNIDHQTAAPTLRKKLQNLPLPVRFAFLSFIFSTIGGFVAGSERLMRDQPANVCLSYSKTGLSFYIWGKFSTLAFLGSRAALVYEFSNSKLCPFVSRRFVIILTSIGLLGFVVTFLLTLFDAKVRVNMVLLEALGICNTIIPIQINAFLNVVDGISSFVLLFFFVLPMIEVVNDALKESKESSVNVLLIERVTSLRKIIKTNLIVGGVTTSLALICSCVVTAIELQPAASAAPVAGGSIRAIDLTANCIMQLYAMKNYFKRKEKYSGNRGLRNKESEDRTSKQLKFDEPLLVEEKSAER